MVTRGEVWMVRLDPTVGSEIQKTRPCVVVSPDGLSHLNTFVVVPMTTSSHPTRFRPEITFDGKPGLLLPDQIRTVARARMTRRLGEIDAGTLSELLATLRTMFED
jgi:mRNA interferase MazF